MTLRKSFIFSMVALLTIAFASGAAAQETTDWTGWYVGAFGGLVNGEVNSEDESHFESTKDIKDDGPMAGIAVSRNHQMDNGWILGGEVMLPLYMKKGTATDAQYFPDRVFYEATYQWGILLAVKGGKNMGQIFPYGYGAIGFTSVNGKTLNVDENDQFSEGFVQEAKATHMLLQFGAGADYQIDPKMRVGVRGGLFNGSKEDHTMSWNSESPENLFGYNGFIIQFNFAYRIK